jgi:hypothetical protein
MKIKISYCLDDNYHPEGKCVAQARKEGKLFIGHGDNFDDAKESLIKVIRKDIEERKMIIPPDEEVEL